jgi:hypothetical protein
MFKSTAKFVMAMIVMTIVCTIVWEVFVFGRLYYCSDPLLDFLHPGDWVHSVNGHLVAVVPHVVAGPTNGLDTDTIKEGWSVTRLWHLWICFIAVSVVLSILLAQIRWVRKQSTERIYEDSHAA